MHIGAPSWRFPGRIDFNPSRAAHETDEGALSLDLAAAHTYSLWCVPPATSRFRAHLIPSYSRMLNDSLNILELFPLVVLTLASPLDHHLVQLRVIFDDTRFFLLVFLLLLFEEFVLGGHEFVFSAELLE